MMLSADVVVVGAGPAGIAAAVTAARSGRSTVLLEREAFAGGIPVKGYISTLCGLYLNGPEKIIPQMLYDSFAREFVALLMHLDGVDGPVRMGKAYVLLCRPESFAAVARRFIENEPTLMVYYRSIFCGAEVINGRIQSIEADLKGRRCLIKPGAVIDTSGDATVCRAAGALLITPDESHQIPAVIFPLHNIKTTEFSTLSSVRLHMMIRHAVVRAVLPPEAAYISFPPVLDPATLIVKLSLGLLMKNEPQISENRIERRANELKNYILLFLKQNAFGFAKCTTPAESSPVLHRESTRGEGNYVLSLQDVLSAKKFPDAVAKGCWPVEKWNKNGNFSVHYLTDGQYYEIPEGALRSSTIDNLFMAGKCISADSGAIASARVIGSCFATGEAAAKLALKTV
jgi:hypothetical protein